MRLDKESLVRAARELPHLITKGKLPLLNVPVFTACYSSEGIFGNAIFAIYFKDTFSVKIKGSRFGIADNSMVLRKHLSLIFTGEKC